MSNVLQGKGAMPIKGQTSSNNNHFSMMRSMFIKTPKTHPDNNTEKRGKNTLYQDHSQYLLKKKAKAMGKQRLNNIQQFNGKPYNDAKNALKRMRSSGYVPPKK